MSAFAGAQLDISGDNVNTVQTLRCGLNFEFCNDSRFSSAGAYADFRKRCRVNDTSSSTVVRS